MAQANPAAAFQGLWRTPELKSKILFTLGCLLLYRIGAHITSPGTTINDCAKMIGITFAEFRRSGMKFFAASRIRPRVIVRCGIWI